jgi:hypothetical protein
MPQETKSHPTDLENAPATQHEKLEGWIPDVAREDELKAALEKAFDYRGDITITLKGGKIVEGYIFDRRTGDSLDESTVRLFPKDRDERIAIRYSDIAALAFTGRDTAAGKSWETWVRKYNERKARGEDNIGIEPEKLD